LTVEQIQLTREELENLARLICLAFRLNDTTGFITYVETPEQKTLRIIYIEKLEDLPQYIDLERLAHELPEPVHGIADPFGQLIQTISNLFKSWFDWLWNQINEHVVKPFTTFFENILSGLSTIINVSGTFLQNLVAVINEYIVRPIGSIIQNVIDGIRQLWNQLDKLGTTIVDYFTKTLPYLLSSLGAQILNALNAIWVNIRDALSWLANQLSSLILSVATSVRTLFNYVVDFFTKTLPNFFANIVNQIWRGIQWLHRQITVAFNNLLKYLSDTFGSLAEFITKTLPNMVAQIGQQLIKTLQGMWNSIVNTVTQLGQRLWSGIQLVWNTLVQIGQQVAQTITNAFSTVANAIKVFANYLSGFVNAILKFPEWFPKWFYENIAKPISDALSGLAKWLWDHMPAAIREAFIKIREFFERAWDFLTKTLPEFFSKLYEGLVDFAKNPAKWFAEYVMKPMWNAIVSLGPEIVKTIGDFGKVVLEGLKQYAEMLKNVAKSVVEFLANLVLSIGNVFKALFDPFLTPLRQAFTTLTSTLSRKVREIAEKRFTMGGELSVFIPVAVTLLENIFIPFAIGFALQMAANMMPKVRLRIQPFGVGAGVEINLSKAIEKLGKFFSDISREIAQGYVIGFGMAFGEALLEGVRHYVNMQLRNVVPIEIPTLTEGKHLLERAYAIDAKFNEVLKKYREWLAMRGFADYIIDLIARKPEEYAIYVTDRFGQQRLVPLAYIYEIPTVSELCRMMVHDIFGSLEDFEKLMRARGICPDIAKLFYFLHFKYPSPEKLWEFVCRCIAGETWFIPTDEMMAEAKSEAEKVGAFVPIAPAKLGEAISKPEVAKLVFRAFSTYMKWHDYAKFAWVRDFTSDNWLIIDVLADIPGKIDLRWMSRWGIFEAWAAWGITTTDRIEDIIKKALNKPAEPVYERLAKMLEQPAIEMDVRQYCRLLQADRLHPLWVPFVAVAETINALTEERTLLRTGFWNLFKEGLFDISAMNKLFAGFFTVKFKVAYFDPVNYKWVDADFNIPVMFLPAEAKLIEIRATMDRAVDLWRDLMREVFSGIRHAVWTPDEAMNILKYFVKKEGKLPFTYKLEKSLSEWFKEAIRKISGKEVELPVDTDWVNLYMFIFRTAYEVEKVLRLRYWLVRIVAWAIYRLAYGYVTKEDIEKLVKIVQEKAKLTQYEADAIREIADLLVGIARREYIPTPMMMASIVEVVPEAKKLVDEVLRKRGVPPEWIPIWKKYIEIRPLVNELTRWRTRLETVFSYGALSYKKFENLISILRNYGWTNEELNVETNIALLYRWQRIFAQIIPSPIGLTGYYRYVQDAMQFLTKKLDAILELDVLKHFMRPEEARRLIDTIKNFYIKLAINRSVYPDVRGYINDLIRAYEYGIIDDATLMRELETLKQYGINDENIKLIIKRAKLRRAIRQARYAR